MNETIRTHLATRFRVCYGVVIAGFLIFMSHEFTRLPPTIFGEDSLAVTHALGAMLFGMGAFAGLRIKCPRCNKGIDRAVGGPLAFPILERKVNNCSYCGVSFDDPLSTHAKNPIS